MVLYGSGNINVLFQNSLRTETPFPHSPSLRQRVLILGDRVEAARGLTPGPAAREGTSGGGSLPGWVDGAGRERARGRGGGSVSAGRSGDQLAGGRAPNVAPALAAAPPPLRVAGWPGGRDNVAGLVAGRRPPSHLKWVPPGCCLAGRQGDRGGGEALPAGSALPEAARIPPFSEPRALESRVLGPGMRFQPRGFYL